MSSLRVVHCLENGKWLDIKHSETGLKYIVRWLQWYQLLSNNCFWIKFMSIWKLIHFDYMYILIEYVYLCMFSLQLHRGQIPNDILADIPQLLRLGLAQRQRGGGLDPTLGVVQARLFSYPRVYCTVDQSLGSHLWGF